jgi:hypothetical protein
MSETWLGFIYIFIALLTTRRVFRMAVPRDMQFPSFERYVLSWILIGAWWWFLGLIFGIYR